MVDRICPFCNVVAQQFSNTRFHRCKNCGLFINIPMDEFQIKEINKNFLLSACKNENTRMLRIKEAHDVQLALIEKYVDVGYVYDVGAASGFFMKAAFDKGWIAHGNDISSKAIKWAKDNYNFKIDYGFLEEQVIENGFYNAVVLWNTLEHTHNPKTTLEKCYNILKTNGVILIKVPNNKTAFELNRNYESVHLFEFTDECLVKHLNAIGFEELYINRNDVCPNYGVVAAIYLFRRV